MSDLNCEGGQEITCFKLYCHRQRKSVIYLKILLNRAKPVLQHKSILNDMYCQ